MRSRFSAYCIGNFQYIFDTYTSRQQHTLSVEALRQSAEGARYFALGIDQARTKDNLVTFKAYYFHKKKVGVLHETSRFVLEESQWRYDDGDIHDDSGLISLGRNDRCPCQSGKKFKQCCLLKIR
ncbi:YchJ family protein [Alteromonas sp. CYL-A6]|uniref:YchJ family protein n=1 Tax=Alteromonas nitratireducens TaxID=3390813 RepID=UPI0034C4D8FB